VEDDAALARKWPAQGETIALEVGGEAWTTERFTRHLDDRMVRGTRGLTFAIGGADGLPAALVARATRRLSLSAMTLPHRMARLVLLEQIYRALSIIRGEPYHH
jgi:23S rRNA (pseudouridine1915-N3)-methyltransferase